MGKMTKISELFCIIQPIHKRLFSLSIPPSNEKGKTHKRAGDCPSYIGIMVCATASGVTQRLEFTFTLPQGSCHQFSEPSVSPDRAWLLIAHCYQTVAPDIKIRLLSQHSPSLLLFPSFLTLIMPCYE